MSDVQLRQIYRDKIYNYRPSRIMRWGVSFFFLFLMLIIVVSGFVKYPDIVPASAEITSINPPANLMARMNGKIEEVFVEEGQSVVKDKVLILLESTARFKDIRVLTDYISMLDSITLNNVDSTVRHPSFFKDKLVLGDIQQNYSELIINYTELYRFLNSGFFEEEHKSLRKKEIVQREYLHQLIQKRTLLEQQFKLAEKRYRRDSIIFDQELIAESEYEQSYQNILQFRSVLVDMDIDIVNSSAALEQLGYDLTKMELKHKADKQQFVVRLTQNIYLLKSRIEAWKQNYLIVAPVDGIVSFTTFWSRNQNVKTGEMVLSVVPDDSMKVKVRLQFPIQNSGKVKEGQRVNIKLHNYPYQEFGMLVGHLSGISKVPNELLYSADVVLADGLVTSYGEKLPRVQQLMGSAEILTDDLSLLMRFFNPLRAVFEEKVQM
ncbi:HlyD family secretion protein [Saccharicrinis carchari]|uniref:HlyD family secretion protein n=1 Tax=Saccharicrinis carchari TaxID=1168039 RepID=A0A521DGH2_SACCC|nr:HlyD family efflux transporter periplasmic adaptor subunit [Saccharicrinis carchari]SMO70864.1 HlyD family secretion protein [Saccharicrinis carchari]